MAANATELYTEMVEAIRRRPTLRTVTDPSSPCKDEIIEAPLGRSFVLRSIEHNLTTCIPVDIRRAKALVLHLYAKTTLATPMAKLPDVLSSLSKVSDRYYWRGAYGPIVMPQIAKCITLLREHPHTRRAVVSLLDGKPHDINRPACISGLQFIQYEDTLHLVATQRALRLDLMPYDCVILTELLRYVSTRVNRPSGELHWYIGSLHARHTPQWDAHNLECVRNLSLHIDTDTPWADLCTLLK